jgi:hypothetical protein
VSPVARACLGHVRHPARRLGEDDLIPEQADDVPLLPLLEPVPEFGHGPIAGVGDDHRVGEPLRPHAVEQVQRDLPLGLERPLALRHPRRV